MSKEEKYRAIALNLLQKYIDSKATVIGELSGNFKESAEILKNEVMGILNALDYGEEKFSELVSDVWLFDEEI